MYNFIINDFYENLIKLYLNISIPSKYNDIAKIGKHNTWYCTDKDDLHISICERKNFRYIVEIDIKSAFPSICSRLFNNIEFINYINNISDKLEKNIFISNSLKDTPYLKLLHQMCPIIVLGIIFDTNDKEKETIKILEIKKDSCCIYCNDDTLYRLRSLNDYNTPFTKFIVNNNFNFNFNKYLLYNRNNKTSTFITNDNMIIKGHYKHVPDKLFETIHDMYKTNNVNTDLINHIYSNKFVKLSKIINLNKFKQYYICNKNLILNQNYKYEPYSSKSIINPTNYISIFINPIIIAFRNLNTII